MMRIKLNLSSIVFFQQKPNDIQHIIKVLQIRFYKFKLVLLKQKKKVFKHFQTMRNKIEVKKYYRSVYHNEVKAVY